MELANDRDPSEDKEDDDPVVTADDMQSIIRTFQTNTLGRLSVDVAQYGVDESADRCDPNHLSELNPVCFRGDASNSKENEFFGLYGY